MLQEVVVEITITLPSISHSFLQSQGFKMTVAGRTRLSADWVDSLAEISFIIQGMKRENNSII